MALSAIQEIVKRLENEKSRDIIIEQRFHGQIIGKSGENMQNGDKSFHLFPLDFQMPQTNPMLLICVATKKRLISFTP